MASSKKPGKPGKTDDAKGKFRETMWFKKGELDAQAAQAAAEEHARTGKVTADKADLLPLDERYKDDGSLSHSDKDRYSLRTGATQANKVVREPGGQVRAGTGTTKVSEDELIGEMKGGRNRILAILAVALAVLAVIVYLIVR
jgi:preprotein translocase subunit SecF